LVNRPQTKMIGQMTRQSRHDQQEGRTWRGRPFSFRGMASLPGHTAARMGVWVPAKRLEFPRMGSSPVHGLLAMAAMVVVGLAGCGKGDGGARATTGPASTSSPATGPFAGLEELGGSDAAQLKELPPQAIAPPGAKRLYAFGGQAPDGLAARIGFLVEGDVAAIESFYKTQLPAQGYKLERSGPSMRPGGVSLAFLNEKEQFYFVNLRPADNNRSVKIILIIGLPAPAGARTAGAGEGG
jgi:hypothetical protein